MLPGRSGKMKTNLISSDLDHIFNHTEHLWEEVRDKRIFITGGTGFFGSWLLESFVWANDKLQLNAEALVLSRDPEAFAEKAAHLCHHRAVQFLRGDIKNFVFPEGRFSYLIHSAVYQQPVDERPSSLSLVNEMLNGTRRVLDFCVQAKIEKMLLISTGAVYGATPSHMEKIPENFSNAYDPTNSSSAYHHTRRIMESLAVLHAEEDNFEAKIARCFSFIGPYLPLNGRFAVSDFIQDAILERPITVRGNGKAVRSYLYMADLAVWLWMILLRGKSGRPYNVGSELPITIQEIAGAIADESVPHLPVSILKESYSGVAQDYYVPDTSRARSELDLQQRIPLQIAVRKTLQWHRDINSRKEHEHD
jgi:nucleoside-diphosphate-sugar epimerase